MEIIAAAVCAAILTYAAGWHFYWGFGGTVGLRLSLPQREDGAPIVPYSRADALAVAVGITAALVFDLTLMRLWPVTLPALWMRLGAGALAATFAIRALSWYRYAGLFKSVRSTPFARYDTWLYGPLALVLALGFGYIALTL